MNPFISSSSSLLKENENINTELTIANETQDFLKVIGEMQSEAHRRRTIIEQLKLQETKILTKLTTLKEKRETLVANVTQANAEVLQLQLNLNKLKQRRRETLAIIVKQRKQKLYWKSLVSLESNIKIINSSYCCDYLFNKNIEKNSIAFQRALHIWELLPQRAIFLQELHHILFKLYAENNKFHNELNNNNKLPDMETIFRYLPTLTDAEKAIIALLPFSK